MAEPAALAIGVAGLSSILGSTMDQIQHFKLGRNFDTTFETDKIRFAYAEHRFSRACKSLGVDLKESNEDVEAALTKVISPGSIEITCKVARKAHDLCEQARRKSENIGRVSKGGIKDAAGMLTGLLKHLSVSCADAFQTRRESVRNGPRTY